MNCPSIVALGFSGIDYLHVDINHREAEGDLFLGEQFRVLT